MDRNAVLLSFLAKVLVPAKEGFEMPQYFLHVKCGQVTVQDQEGIERANPAQAEEEAARRTQGCLADNTRSPGTDQAGGLRFR